MPIIYFPRKGLDIANDEIKTDNYKKATENSNPTLLSSFNISEAQYNKNENPYISSDKGRVWGLQPRCFTSHSNFNTSYDRCNKFGSSFTNKIVISDESILAASDTQKMQRTLNLKYIVF